MKDPRRVLLVGAIVMLAAMFGAAYIRDSKKTSDEKTSELQTPSPTIAPTPSEFSDWKLFRNGYAFPLPPQWKNTSDKGGRATFAPGEKIGSIQEIIVSKLSDAKAPQGQRFTTQPEFDQWSAVEGEVQGPIQKLENLTLDGEKAIKLMDTTAGENAWNVIVWTRKDAINLYITFHGNQKYGADDATAIDYMVSHFTFTAPPTTPGEDKK